MQNYFNRNLHPMKIKLPNFMQYDFSDSVPREGIEEQKC